MTKTIEGRTHGDARLLPDESFFDVTNEEYDHYLELLRTIVTRLNLDEYALIDAADPTELQSAILMLKQKYEIAYSNGCPWPEMATFTQIAQELEHNKNEEELRELRLSDVIRLIKESRNADARASFLFKLLLESANESLKQELLAYQPWKRLEEQEDDNLPDRITREIEPQSYALANDLPYFKVIKPLLSFIYDRNKNAIVQDRYQRVLEFF